MKEVKNTDKEFYQLWSREQLIKELCRLNQLLVDCLRIIEKAPIEGLSGEEDYLANKKKEKK